MGIMIMLIFIYSICPHKEGPLDEASKIEQDITKSIGFKGTKTDEAHTYCTVHRVIF